MERLPTIAEAHHLIRQGQLTPLELVEHCLARIEQFEERIQAWVHVDAAGARDQAERQTRLAREGRAEGTLFGIPIGIKDIIDVAGMKTQCGSPLLADNVATEDAPVVAALRRQGAIILGKTVTTQFACFDPAVTRNPWNLDHSPGGSSSGSAAAVAMEMCLAALGTQTGGSILRPASYCGVVGFKPTFGSLDMRGIQPVSRRLDHVGPIARNVADATAMWRAMASEDSNRPDISRAVETDPAQTIRFGNPKAWVKGECVVRVLLAFTRGMAGIAACGEVREVELGLPLADVLRAHRSIMAVDVAEELWPRFAAARESFAHGLASLLDEGRRTSRADYDAALAVQDQVRASIVAALESVDVLVLPSTTTVAPPLMFQSTGDPRLNSPFSLSGHPAITLPVRVPPHLPCGVQLVGRLRTDAALLRLALRLDEILKEAGLRPTDLPLS